MDKFVHKHTYLCPGGRVKRLINTYVPTIKKRRIEHKRIYGENVLRALRVFLALLVTGSLLAVPAWFHFGKSAASPNNDSLAAYYKFDETTAGTAADSSGDGNSGTVTGATASTALPQDGLSAPAIQFDNARALDFDGNDYVEVADAPELSANAITVSAWVKLDSVTGIQTIVAKWDVSHWQEYTLQTMDDDLYFYTGDGSNVTSDFISLPNVLTAGAWYHVAGVIDGTNRSIHVTEAGGATTSDSDTALTAMSGSDIELTIGAKKNNAGPYFEFLDGTIDDVRVYNRALGAGELADLAAGNHTAAIWDGSASADYDTAANWDTGAVPDPFTMVTIADSSNQPVASSDVVLAGLAIDSGARFSLDGWDLTINDSGTFVNNGTLQLKNSETLTGFSNDTDSGTVLLTPDADLAGFAAGNSYNNLVLSASTFAHWPLDEAAGPAADVSGFERTAAYQGAAAADSTVPATRFANDNSITLDGTADYLSFDSAVIPDNATYCAWVNMDAGSGVVLGAAGSNHYALKINGGNEIAVNNEADSDLVTWNIGSVYSGWHHICLTQTKTMLIYSLNLFVDGAAVGSAEELDNGVGAVDAIGRGGSSYFDGRIDDVRIYSRILNPTDISLLAAGEEPAGYTATQTLDGALNIGGDLVLASGRLDVSASNYDITIGGDLRGDGGVFVAQGGEVTLSGADQSINSSFAFQDLTKQVTSAATLTFGKDSTTTVNGMLTLTGQSGELLSLRSSTSGVQWLLDPAGDETVSYLDVQDSNNISVDPVDITGDNVTDSGNNINWTVNVPPDDPVSLGPTQFVDGSFTTDMTPTLTFSLADDNPGDSLRFQIQIDDNSDFSSPEVDYISDAGAHGSRSFTPGQNGSDDTYNAGTDDMLMVTGDYYWRVKAIDDYSSPHESAYAVANGGSIAFRLDVSGPTTPGTPTTVSSSTNRRPAWNWTASTDSGSGLASPTYTLQWSTDNTFNTGVSAATTNNLTYTHSTNLADGQWYFRVRAADTLGNNSAWATSSVHLIDNTGPTTPVAPFTASPTSITTPTWSWAAPTDAGIGLDPTNPYILNWSLTSNFSSGVSSTTHSTNTFTHGTGLTDGTWYMRVKAVDALGNESAWSANGTVLIDGSAPTLPGAPQTADPTNDDTPAWTWDASLDTGAGLHSTIPYAVQWSTSPSFSPIAGSTTSSTNGYTHGTPLADGTWYIRVSARDALNNQSGYSATGQTTIDTVAPDVPAAPTTTTPTNDDTPTWTWVEPNDTGVGLSGTPYTIQWSTDETFSTIEDSDTLADTSFTQPSSLAEGTWYFRVSATDAAGNTSAYSDPGEVYIDITPPTVPGDPSTADPVNDDLPTWTWLVSTDSGIGLDDPAYVVEWSQDNTFGSGVGSDQTNTNEYTHGSELTDGTWYFRVKAIDAVGNESAWSNLGSKIVDVNPPTVPGTPTTTSPTADNTPAWTWTASTDAGQGLDELPYMIEWSQDEDFLIGVQSDTIAPNSFTHTDPLADGTWYFRVRAADDVGNISAYSPVGSVFVDASPPSKPGDPATSTPTVDDTPTWTWTASTDGSGTGLATNGYIIEWSTASDLSVDMQSGTSTTNSFTHTDPLADGQWYFRVRAVDVVGNESEDSEIGSVEVDNTPPSVPGQPATDTPTDNDTPAWTWSASTDNYIGLADPAYEVQWSTDSGFGSITGSATVNDTEYTHGVSLADGQWYFRVRAEDNLGNQSAFSSLGAVLISTDGPSVPGVPTTDDPTTDTTPTWTWAASTSDAGLATPAYQIEWSTDADFLVNVLSDTVPGESFTHTDDLADGTWYFRVRAEDNTGLFSAYSAAGTVLVDTTAPSVPGTPSTTTPTSDRTPTWTWAVSSDAGVGLDTNPYLIEWSQDNTFVAGVSSAAAPGASFIHTDDLADGTWYFRVRAVDGLGNQSAFSLNASVVVDATAPSVPGTPSTTTPTSDRTPLWSWGASSDSGVGLDSPAYEIEWSTSSTFASGIQNDSTDNLNFSHVSNLADGTWYFRVRAVDAVGNRSAFSANGSVVIDGSIPSAPGVPTVGVPATNDDTPTWTWAASTDSGTGLGSPAYELEWSQDENFLSGVVSDTSASASFTHTSGLTEGIWYLHVRAVDAVGNRSGYSGIGEVYIDTDTPTAPGTPTPAASPTNDRTPTWTWSASTDEGFGFGDEPYELAWSQSSDFSSGVTNGTAADENFTHASNLADGTWYFRVRAVDDALNTSAWSSAGMVVIDATAPTLPANLQTDTPTKDDTPEWTWDESTDAGVGIADPLYELEWSKDSGFASGVSSETTNDEVFTHTTGLDFGVWHFRVRAVDLLDNKSAWVSSSVYIDSDPPVISEISATPGSTSVTITWKTDEIASSKVEFGTGSNLTENTEETDTSPRVTNHSVTIQGLPSCVAFTFRVISTDQLDNQAVSGTDNFTTTACSGNAAIMGQSTTGVAAASGGQASLNGGSAAVNLTIPAGFAADNTDFQIKQLSPGPALQPLGQPAGRSLVGSHLYDLKAVQPQNVLVTSFNGGIQVSMTYTAAEAVGFTISSLAIFRHDGTSWQQLNGCSVNTTARTVTCSTTNFSVFGLFGVRAPAAPAAEIPEGNGTVEPDPLPVTPQDKPDTGKVVDAVSDSRGIGGAFTKVVQTLKRPVWWGTLLLALLSVGAIIMLKKRQGRKGHLPYGIHRDKD